MKKIIQLWFLIGILTGSATVVIFIINYLNTAVLCDVDCSIRNRVTLALVFSSLFAMFVGSFTYYFIAEKYEKKIKKIRKDYSATFKFLPTDQRKVVQALIQHQGTMNQSDLVRYLDISRVKVSRMLKVLKQKEILDCFENGMTNTIVLATDLKNLFSK